MQRAPMTGARRLLLPAASIGLVAAFVLAATSPAGPTRSHLTRIYRGDDGSALYARLVGSTLYGFGEHPGKGLAFVLRGTVEGSAVKDVTYWLVPKGGTSGRGTMELRWSQNGARLVRITPGATLPAVWQAISPSGIPWPNRVVAGFQSPNQSNLTGAFTGGGSRAYVAENIGAQADEVVGVVEKESQPGERPGSVAVFVGMRSGNVVTGAYTEVPKGVTASRQGSFTLSVGANRTLTLTNVAGRSTTLYPDYALDFEVFGSRVEQALGGGASFGYSWAVAQNGVVVRRGAGGTARVLSNGKKVPFTPKTMSQAASTSKTLSAVLLMKVLLERGIAVDAKIGPYLPSCWTQGPGVSQLTFRDLLAHTTGFRDANQSCSDDPLACLRKAIEKGGRPATGYQNINYALLRAVVPLVDKPEESRQAFESRGCEDTNGAINQFISQRFLLRLTRMLEPFDVALSFYPVGRPFACVYDNRSRRKPGVCPRVDFFRRAGAGYVSITAVDYVRFLSAFDRGLIVPKKTVELMKTGPLELGFDSAKTGAAGAYVWKNGACPGSSTGTGCSALAMIFAGDVQAYAMTNSGRNNSGATAATLDETLQGAFDAALK
jgi:CubicO group peptidase (beta-lactamase class C family)